MVFIAQNSPDFDPKTLFTEHFNPFIHCFNASNLKQYLFRIKNSGKIIQCIFFAQKKTPTLDTPQLTNFFVEPATQPQTNTITQFN